MALTLTIQTTDELLERCKQGDMAGYEVLYNRYAKAMYNTSLRIVNHSAEAEDILQESFIDAFRWLNTFQNRSSFGAWLKRIVVNKSINRIKRRKFRFVEMEGRYEALPEDAVQDEEEWGFQLEQVKKAITLLPTGYRTIFCLHLLEEYRHDEIAEMLGISSSTVRTQYIRAKKKLLDILQTKNSV